MKNCSLALVLMCLMNLASGCSTIKVLDAWKSDDIATIKTKNILVIARTAHKPSREAFEQGIVKELAKKGLKGKEISQTTTEGGYEAGASLSSYYNMSYVGFYGYYASPGSYASFDGVEVEETMTTKTNKIYVLETSVHNLDLPEKEQLVALVTSKIDQPESITALADEYAKAIAKALK